MSLTLKQAWCKVAEWCENPPWSDSDLDEQTLAVNCEAGTLDISKGNSVALDRLGCKTVYRWSTTQGFNYREWTNDAGPHLDPREWDGPTDYTGFNLPTAAAPDFQGVDNNSYLGDSEHTGGAMRYAIYDGWLYAPSDGFLRDVNGNTGELGFVAFGGCCDTLAEKPGGNTTNTSSQDATLLDSSPIKEGWNYVVVLISDLSAFHGVQLQFSADETSWSIVTEVSAEAPSVETQQLNACEEIPEGWQQEPLYPCCPPKPANSGGEAGLSTEEVQALIDVQDHDDPQPATALPVADGDPGTVGTSLLYARADHQHPCAPNLPLLDYDLLRPTLVGPATELANSNFDRESTDRLQIFDYRVRFLADAATNGWVYIQAAPNPPGYTLLEFECHGAYYQIGSQDINTAGVTPYEEQYMGGNGVEWVRGRIYYLHFSASRKFEDVNVYARVQATYKKIT